MIEYIRERLLRRPSFGGPAGDLPASVGRYFSHAVDLSQDILEAAYCVLDTELTGLDFGRDRVVSIGAVKMTGARITELGDYYYRIIKPASELSVRSVVVHGITPAETSSCPSIERLLPEFLDFCTGRVMVGHVVSIDRRFLDDELKRLYGRRLRNPFIDIMSVHRWLHQERIGSSREWDVSSGTVASLEKLMGEYGVEGKGLHNALLDAFVTAQIFQRQLRQLRERGVHTLKSLVRIAGA